MTDPVVPPFVLMSDAEGLKTSAVAVALTLFPVFPHMREKKDGTPVAYDLDGHERIYAERAPPANETQLFDAGTPPAE